MTDAKKPETGALSQWKELERRESSLWRTSLLLLVLLAFTIGFITMQPARALPGHFRLLSLGLVILVVLFGAYAWTQKRKIAQLRRMADDRNLPLSIEVDGGIGRDTIAACWRAGADTFVAGNAIFGASDPGAEIGALRECCRVIT